MTFLEKCAQNLLELPGKLEDKIVLVPSKRAVSYLQEAFFNNIDKPILLPYLTDFNSFIFEQSGLKPIDQTTALFELYQVYIAINKNQETDFDSFMVWAPSFLADINQIDLHKVPAKDFFKNLKEIKDIESWSFNTESNLSKGQEKFNAFWVNLLPLYQNYKAHLLSKKMAYAGLAIEQLNVNISQLCDNTPSDGLIIIGLNAMSPAEISFYNTLAQEGKAQLWLQTDEYILKHEAGFFQNKVKDLKGVQLFENENAGIKYKKKYREIGVNGISATTATVNKLLSEMSVAAQQKTAVVLMNEELAFNIISYLPQNIEVYNLSIGIGLNRLPAGSWLNIYFDTLQNATFDSSGNVYFSVSLISELLQHSFAQEFGTEALGSTVKKIMTKKLIEKKELNRLLNQDSWLAPNLTGKKQLLSEHIEGLISIFDKAKGKITENTPDLAVESLLMVQKAINELLKSASVFNEKISLKTFAQLLSRFLGKHKIPVLGEPLQGIQITGLLETRSIDFERVILVGANENELPGISFDNTLAPYDLLKYFKLPGVFEKESLMAYYFFRLLINPSEITVLFDNGSQSIGSVEKSRYLLQIEEELPNFEKEELSVSFDIERDEPRENLDYFLLNQEQQTKFFEERLLHPKVYLSASALSNALYRPVDFLNSFILGIDNNEATAELLPAAELGTAIHNVLEDFYKPFVGQNLSSEAIEERLKNDFELVLEKQLKGVFNEMIPAEYRLRRHLVEKQSRKVIASDIVRIKKAKHPIKLLGVEIELKSEIKNLLLECSGCNVTVKTKGLIDRVELSNNTIYLIDYKTGSVKNDMPQILDFDKIDNALDLRESEGYLEPNGNAFKSVPKYFFQGIFYEMLWRNSSFYQSGHDIKFGFFFTLKNNPTSATWVKLPEDKNHLVQKAISSALSITKFNVLKGY
jgi:ATP-dependent helicase/nuclease subunit B